MTKPNNYRFALRWIARNTDCEWLANPAQELPAPAALVADLFCLPAAVVRRDLTSMSKGEIVS
jgi:hypothetical protein